MEYGENELSGNKGKQSLVVLTFKDKHTHCFVLLFFYLSINICDNVVTLSYYYIWYKTIIMAA